MSRLRGEVWGIVVRTQDVESEDMDLSQSGSQNVCLRAPTL